MAIEFPATWHGDEPFCLIHASAPPIMTIEVDGEPKQVELNPIVTVIDIEEPAWMTTHNALFHSPGQWYLARKVSGAVEIAINVEPGEKAFWFMRHRAIGAGGPDPETGAVPVTQIKGYCLGVKKPDDSLHHLWYLENGLRCMDDDFEHFARDALMRR